MADFSGQVVLITGAARGLGLSYARYIAELQESAFEQMMTIAAKAPLWLAQAAWPSMQAAGYGRIVMTTSCRALYPQYVQQGLASYAAAKMAVVGLMNVLALEGRAHGIVVNAVSPVAKTRMWGIDGEPDELRPSEVAPGSLTWHPQHVAKGDGYCVQQMVSFMQPKPWKRLAWIIREICARLSHIAQTMWRKTGRRLHLPMSSRVRDE